MDDQAPARPRDNPAEIGREWMRRIRASEKADEAWIDDATEAEVAYLHDDRAERGRVYDLNILHSNIETIAPSLYNSTPVPDIRERFRAGASDADTSAARVVAQVIERALMVQIDDGRLDTEAEDMVHDALLAGRGVLRVRFDADVQTIPAAPVVDPMTGQPVIDPATGAPAMTPERRVATNERLVYEAVSWRDYREGPAKRWRDVPWIAFRHCLPREEVDRIRDPELREALGSSDPVEEPIGEAEDDVILWEVWCRESRRVYMVVDASSELLSQRDDPMELSGFFPCIKPVQPLGVTGRRTPVVPFKVYRSLAKELEDVTRRIGRIVDGLRVRGLFVGEAGDLERLAEASDNVLIPVANLEQFAQVGGLDRAISWWPLDAAIATLRELYAARDQTKAMIYEVTGISDIVRGQGKATETATAQEIKAQWGSLRIRRLQRQVERGIRDVFVLSAEIIGAKFSPETLQRMTGIAIPPDALALLSRPLDHYRIDVESDSTVRADLTRRRGEMGQFLEGTGAFFGTMAPLVAQAPQLASPVAELYAAFARQFSLGKQAEDAIEMLAAMARQAGAQPPPPPPAEAAKADKVAAEAAKIRTETALMGGPVAQPPAAPPGAPVM